MSNPNFIILYVANPLSSAEFYSRLLKKTPIDTSPNFAMFALDSGAMLGLWSAHTVEPIATMPGGSELAFSVADNEVVNAMYAEWIRLGQVIAQTPTKMDFGYTFVAQDPDGHRLRVFTPRAA